MSAELTMTDAPARQNHGGEEQFGGSDESNRSDGANGANGSDGSDGPGGYELDENGQRVAHGQGQSKSSRRRRRKRKGKGDGPDTGEVASMQGSAEASSAAAPAAPPPVGPPQFRQSRESRGSNSSGSASGANGGGQNMAAQNGGQNSQNAPGGTKRWKKKNFRERDRPRGGSGENSGNPGGQGGQGSFAGSGQNSPQQHGQPNNGAGISRGADTHQPGNNAFKRKGGSNGGGGGFGGRQQRSGGGGGSRGGFVGPMDHSYRSPNGNIFESSPSTIDPFMGSGGGRGGGGRSFHSSGDSQPIDYSMGRAIPIKEDAPTKIYFFIEDLFFTAKIQETARKLGVKVAFIKNEKEQIAALTGAEEEDRPGLIVFDLNNANAKPMTLIPKLKAKLKKSTSIIGFLSHLQGDLKAKAVEVGCDTVMPRAAFSQNLPNLLRRYGIEEAEEPNYNQ